MTADGFRALSLLLGLTLASMLVTGCDNSNGRIDELNADLKQLKGEVKELSAKVAQQETDRDLEKLIQSFDKFAYLTPGAEGYSLVSYDLGVLTVQLADVRPYANGSKATLKFGNPLSASITGLKLTVDWGKVSANGSPDNVGQKSKELTLSQDIRSGAWSSVPIVLEGVPANELGFVRVHDVTHTGVRLSVR